MLQVKAEKLEYPAQEIVENIAIEKEICIRLRKMKFHAVFCMQQEHWTEYHHIITVQLQILRFTVLEENLHKFQSYNSNHQSKQQLNWCPHDAK